MKYVYGVLFIVFISWIAWSCSPSGKVSKPLNNHGKIAQHIAELKKKNGFKDSVIVTESNKTIANKAGQKLAASIIESEFATTMVMEKRPENFTLLAPVNGHTVKLLLYKPDKEIKPTIKTDKGIILDDAFQSYQGVIDGAETKSLVNLTWSSNGPEGSVTDSTGTYSISNYLGSTIVSKDTTKPFECKALEIPGRIAQRFTSAMESATTSKCVNLYWEVDYDLYVRLGSSTANVTSYLHTLFNGVQTLYANDGITVNLKSVFIWTAQDPFIGTSTFQFLDQFGTYLEQHPGRLDGDIAMLIGTQGNGGVAWVGAIGDCGGGVDRYKCGYAGVFGSATTYPTYGWDVLVLTHEEGHLLGSPHTQDCVWNGNGTAIDSCSQKANYGGCSIIGAGNIALPYGIGGTIMSYCHLIAGIGINFSLGFGSQVAALIINTINNSSCLSVCGPSPPNSPPTVNLGKDTTITLPQSSINLTAFVMDDLGDTETFLWTQISGTSASIIFPSAKSTTISGLVQGSYTFRFKATDQGGLSATDDINVTVNATPPPPPPNTFCPVTVCPAGYHVDQISVLRFDTTAKQVKAIPSGGTNYTYKWMVNSTVSAVKTQFILKAGNYKSGDIITVCVGSTNGATLKNCYANGQKSITIK